MAIVTDPDNLSQGGSKSVSDAVWGTPSGSNVTVTSAGGNLPTIAASRFLEVRDHSNSANNGLYYTSGTPSSSSVDLTKLTGSAPEAASSEVVTTLGSTADPKNIHLDCAARKIYLMEIGAVSADGVHGQAVWSFLNEEWPADNYLRGAAPFPMQCIDADAGKYILGQDPSGNYNGWDFGEIVSPVVRTRKLLRNCGYSTYSSTGTLLQIYACITTVGTFEDSASDLAYYKFGTNQATNDTQDFSFAGPLNEAVLCYDATVTRASTDGYDFVDGGAGDDSIERSDGGSFITDGYKVGGYVEVQDSTTPANDGTHLVTSVSASVLGVPTGSFTDGLDDETAQLAVDNRLSFTAYLRVRDEDPTGKTFAQSNLASANETSLSNRKFGFPLANAADPKITVTDATIDGSTPYTGMTATYYATPQSLGGSGLLVGGPYNFGIVIDANGGSKEQVNAWWKRQARKTTDIDAGAGTVIGKCADDLMRFVGDNLEVGTVDSGNSFPTNPQGGGSGVFITNLAASSQNYTALWDNTSTKRLFSEVVAGVIDFNEVALGDTNLTYALYFDRTTRTEVADLQINSAGTFTSSSGDLPASIDGGAGSFVRVAGLTGVDAPMNGIYQVTALTSTSSWNVRRFDGAAIITTTAATANVDEHPIDSPGSIVVKNSVGSDISGTASSDVSVGIDYSNNIQGGRTPGTPLYVVGRCWGKESAQPAQSSVVVISSGVSFTVSLAATIQRNYYNPA